jgi:hypothetical protein
MPALKTSGKLLFSANYDATKWKAAADAAKAAIVECEARGLHLNTTAPTTGVSSASDEMKRVLTLQSAVTGKWEQNPELIWALNYGFGYQGFVIPKLTSAAVGMANTYPSNWAVPISASRDLFYTNKGVPIGEDKTFDYSGRFTPQAGDDANKHYVKQGYETARATLTASHAITPALVSMAVYGLATERLTSPMTPYVQAKGIFATAGPKSFNSTNITGIWPKKLANYQTVMDQTFDVMNYQLPIIRCRACTFYMPKRLNEAEGPSAEVYTYIDRVRARAGLEGVQSAWANYSNSPGKAASKDGLRQIIHQERRIELAFEGQIGWDLRRWKELQEVLSKPLQGWNINETSSAAYYRPNTVVIPGIWCKGLLVPYCYAGYHYQ